MDEFHEGMQERSKWPILLAVAITLLAVGIVSSLVITVLGILLLLFSLGGWTQENRSLAQRYALEEEEEEGE